jgi:hypothetical protein
MPRDGLDRTPFPPRQRWKSERGVHLRDQPFRIGQREVLTSAMPFKSQAQRRKFAQLLVEGKISHKTFEEWNRETGARKLPEHVKNASTSRARARRKRRSS